MRRKFCLYCNKEFERPIRIGIGNWKKRKYCSHKCYWKNKHDIPWNKGKKLLHLQGEKSYWWKGEKASYIAKHLWVSKQLGKPSKCEHCGNTKVRCEWANKSRKYKRDLTDWIRLCYSCHEKYDITWINRQRNILGRFT